MGEALDEVATAVLRRIAEWHGLSVSGGTRAEMQQALVGRLTDPDYVRAQMEELSPAERKALVVARTLGGEVRGFVLSRTLAGNPGTLARDLLDRGLLFRRFVAQGAARGEIFTVPEEVLALVPGESDDARPMTLPAAREAPPRTEQRTTDPAVSLFALASFVSRHGPPASAGQDGKEIAALGQEVRGWTREPGGWDWQARWALLDHLGRALGWLGEEHGARVVAPRLSTALRHREQLAQRLWHAYLEDRHWSDLNHAGVPHADVLDEQAASPDVRREIGQVLALLPAGQWTALSDLVTWMEDVAPGILRSRLDARSAGLMDARREQPLLGPGTWDAVEGALIRYLVLGPFYWLGLLASDAAGERVAITGRGFAVLTGALLQQPAHATEPCTWEGTADTLLASPWSDLGLLLRVETYLTLEERGQTSRYRLRQARAAEALGRGGSVAEARELLEELTGSSLPDAVAALLTSWADREGAFQIRPAVLLEARSADALDAVLEDREAAPLVRGRVGERTVEVAASHALALDALLRKRGELPKVDAALRLLSGRRAYAQLVDEEVLELLLVLLWGLEAARPEHLAQLEGAPALLRRLETLFPPERNQDLRRTADRLMGDLIRAPGDTAPIRRRGSRGRKTTTKRPISGR